MDNLYHHHFRSAFMVSIPTKPPSFFLYKFKSWVFALWKFTEIRNIFCTVSCDVRLCCLLISLLSLSCYQTQRTSQVPKCLKSHLHPSHLCSLSEIPSYSIESFNKRLFAFIILCSQSLILLCSLFFPWVHLKNLFWLVRGLFFHFGFGVSLDFVLSSLMSSFSVKI